ncbi:hypothetical protein JNJ66_06015 [Candidatus Saccharibacteria bacterium]|nr:hypothetical protein [Candidatus Saccharibacteria bacterium]
MAGYTYRGARVLIAGTADMPRTMRPGGRFSGLVQELLDEIDPWRGSQHIIETLWDTGEPVLPMAVPVLGRRRIWGVHVRHRAREPKLSPFVAPRTKWVNQGDRRVEAITEPTGPLTIELTGTVDKPTLIRAYGGEYTPPLPWMSSADKAEGGRDACLAFWMEHAYLMSTDALIREGSRTTRPPRWFAGRPGDNPGRRDDAPRRSPDGVQRRGRGRRGHGRGRGRDRGRGPNDGNRSVA